MLIKKLALPTLFLGLTCVCVSAQVRALAQVTETPQQLESGKPVEREIAGGKSHTYQISLKAGQFARFRLAQRAIDAALILAAPDGKRLSDLNLAVADDEESLSLEAPVAGNYRLTVRGLGAAALRGSYRLEASVEAQPTAQDRKRLTAETLLGEAFELKKEAGRTAQQVIEKAQQALQLWSELNEQRATAHTLFLIGNAYYDLSQFPKAAEYWEQALPLFRAMKNRSSEANTLNNLGIIYKNLNRYEKAIEYSEQALVLLREARDKSGESTALNSLGSVYMALSRNEKAVEYYEQALVISREARDKGAEGRTLTNLGNIYASWSQSDKAIESFEQALVAFREAKNRPGEGLALNGLGLVYRDLGRNEKAMESLELALAIHRETKNRGSEISVLTSLGAMFFGMGQYEKAIENFRITLAFHREVKNRLGEARALGNLGASFLDMGQSEKALEYFEQALVAHREVKSRRGEAFVLANIGSMYSRLNRDEKAIEFYKQSLAVDRDTKNLLGVANTLNNIGDAYNHLEQYSKAIEYLEQGLALTREIKDPDTEAYVLNNLGDAYAPSKRYAKAVEYYEQALALHREAKRRREEAVALTSLSNVQRQVGQTDRAAEFGAQALAILREIGASDLEVRTLYALAQNESARGNLAQAQKFLEESLRSAELMRAGLVSPESRTSFLATVQSSYQLYTHILMSRYKAERKQGFAAQALETSERQRARSLLDLLVEARADLRQGVDAALIERERSLRLQLNEKAQRLTQANTPQQSAELKQQISELENDYERTQAAIRRNNSHYAALVQPQPLKLTEIQQQLDANTLLLEYAMGEERSYLWAITRDSLTSYELPKGEQIKRTALQVYELLTARSTSKRGESTLQRQQRIANADNALPAAAQELSQILLAPVASQLGNKRLVIVADGALQYIPFAMLPVPDARDRTGRRVAALPRHRSIPLIVNHQVTSLPSASALAIQRSELAGRQSAPKMLAVIADPVFDRTDERFKSAARQATEKERPQIIALNDQRSIEHLAVKSEDKENTTSSRLIIPRLPYTRQEADQLLALAPKSSSFRAVDFQASRTTVLDALSQYRYVHFATHGFLDSERPGLSSLVLSMVDEQGQAQDGFLRLHDIYNLKLSADLVVLSACQTGLGKEIKGEGLDGMMRGFMYAGAERVVVSLWNVNDKATADLMTRFYEKMLKQGERPAAALRAAQVSMLKQKQWQSPYYWAAFTMQGDWR